VERSRARWSARGAGDMDVTRADADGRFSSLSSTTSPAPAAVRASLSSTTEVWRMESFLPPCVRNSRIDFARFHGAALSRPGGHKKPGH